MQPNDMRNTEELATTVPCKSWSKEILRICRYYVPLIVGILIAYFAYYMKRSRNFDDGKPEVYDIKGKLNNVAGNRFKLLDLSVASLQNSTQGQSTLLVYIDIQINGRPWPTTDLISLCVAQPGDTLPSFHRMQACGGNVSMMLIPSLPYNDEEDQHHSHYINGGSGGGSTQNGGQQNSQNSNEYETYHHHDAVIVSATQALAEARILLPANTLSQMYDLESQYRTEPHQAAQQNTSIQLILENHNLLAYASISYTITATVYTGRHPYFWVHLFYEIGIKMIQQVQHLMRNAFWHRSHTVHHIPDTITVFCQHIPKHVFGYLQRWWTSSSNWIYQKLQHHLPPAVLHSILRFGHHIYRELSRLWRSTQKSCFWCLVHVLQRGRLFLRHYWFPVVDYFLSVYEELWVYAEEEYYDMFMVYRSWEKKLLFFWKTYIQPRTCEHHHATTNNAIIDLLFSSSKTFSSPPTFPSYSYFTSVFNKWISYLHLQCHSGSNESSSSSLLPPFWQRDVESSPISTFVATLFNLIEPFLPPRLYLCTVFLNRSYCIVGIVILLNISLYILSKCSILCNRVMMPTYTGVSIIDPFSIRRMLLSLFIHLDVVHLLINMNSLVVIGYKAVRLLNCDILLWLGCYMASGIAGNMAWLVWCWLWSVSSNKKGEKNTTINSRRNTNVTNRSSENTALESSAVSVGASGAISGLCTLVMVLAHHPSVSYGNKVRFSSPLMASSPMSYLISIIVNDWFYGLFFNHRVNTVAHVGGAIMGFVLGAMILG